MARRKLRFAFVTTRYGDEVVGGAEFLTRLLAEHMSPKYDVTVITTKAVDHVSWQDFYPADAEECGGVKVRRFSVDHPRRQTEMEQIPIYSRKVTLEQEEAWMKAQGPYSSKLLKYLKDHRDYYDFFIFCPYLYATTYFGYQLVKEKAILIPAAHDEPVFYLNMFKKMLCEIRGFICSTPEELELIRSFCGVNNMPAAVIGVGLEKSAAKPVSIDMLRSKFGIKKPYIAYVGRIEPGKGLKDLFNSFDYYRSTYPSPVQLVMAGRAVMDLPRRSYIHYLGYVSAEEKYGLLENAICTVNPSRFESLSILLLESWKVKRPVLVNGFCEVLEGQVSRASAGLTYRDKEEFSSAIDWFRNNPKLAAELGQNGKRYLELNYEWPTIMNKIERFFSMF